MHHAVDLNVAIGCGEAPVFPGDILVGDADGVIVIPAEIADEIAEEATHMTLYEDFVTEMVARGESILGLYPLTDSKYEQRFEAWRRERNR